MHIRISLHGAVAGLIVHPGDNMPVGMGRGVKGRGAWMVLFAVPHVVVDVVTAFGPATVWIRSHEPGISGTNPETSSQREHQRRDLHRFATLTTQSSGACPACFRQFACRL